ncbi:MAG: SDR family NAD(P)-dependent oxidoreductase, partial [Candidatus Omnitrophica bacterium]|nr:SDR family NAD(P)-dependent oxidoreductase [Candidatus Omnitrophota bacterium]
MLRSRHRALAPATPHPAPWSDLSGRIALVTGASRGLGAAMAFALAQAGATMVLWARQADRLARVARTIRALGRQAIIQCIDVTDPQAVRRTVRQMRRRVPRVDILVNNAGVWGGDPLVRLSLKTWSRVLATDLTSVFVVSQAIAPSMIRQRYGKIINISSTSAILAHPEGAAYCAAKAGVVHLTRVMAVELGPAGIRVNSI